MCRTSHEMKDNQIWGRFVGDGHGTQYQGRARRRGVVRSYTAEDVGRSDNTIFDIDQWANKVSGTSDHNNDGTINQEEDEDSQWGKGYPQQTKLLAVSPAIPINMGNASRDSKAKSLASSYREETEKTSLVDFMKRAEKNERLIRNEEEEEDEEVDEDCRDSQDNQDEEEDQ